jgi:uncharacterized membrane protein
MTDAPPDVPETPGRRVGRWLLALFYAAAGVAHVLFTDAMARIVPAWVPWDAREVVLTTGAVELVCAAALLTRKWRLTAGWALALYALCVWPANVKHAMIDLAWLGGSGTGLSTWYHVPRLLAQPLLILWALWAVGAVRVKRGGAARKELSGRN